MADSKYAQALGVWEFQINNVPFRLKPIKGDNLKLLKLQKEHDKDQLGMIEAFVPFMADIIVRSEPEADREEVETFVERNFMSFLKETMIGFGWMTREKWDENEQNAVKKSLESAE